MAPGQAEQARSPEDEIADALGEPEPARVEAAGRIIEIHEVRLGQLAAFSKAIKPLWGAIGSLTGEQDGEARERIAGLIIEHGDDVVNAIEVATPLERHEVENLGIDETLEVVEAIIAVNADFFTRRVLPKFRAMLLRTMAKGTTTEQGATGST